MSVIPLGLEIFAAGLLAAFFLHRYGNWRKQPLMVTAAAFISWYFSFLIIIILPLDVSHTIYNQCLQDNIPKITLPSDGKNTTTVLSSMLQTREISTHFNNTKSYTVYDNDSLLPNVTNKTDIIDIQSICKKPWSYVPSVVLPTMWRVVYWTSQFLTWLLLPMMQSYANAGDFTVIGKLKSSLIENAIYYGSYLLIFIVCLIYVAVRPDLHVDGSQLKVLAITASNTWGLFLLVLLLGYGLVDIPRSLWNGSKRGLLLSQTYFKIAKLSTEKSEADETLEDLLEDVKKAAETINQSNPLRQHVNTILKKCPESLQNSVKKDIGDYEDYLNPTETPTEKSLVRLHKNVIKASQNYHRTHCQWNLLIEKAFDHEDIAMNEMSDHHYFVRSFGRYQGFFSRCYNSSAEWYWKCWIRPVIYKVLACSLGVFSFMVVWSECLFFISSPNLSFFSIFVEIASKHYNYFKIELVSGMTIAYIAVTAYYTVFKIRIFNYYYLAAHHQTDANSLLFCGMLLCRLTPPLCLNFLGLIHLDDHVTKDENIVETAYTHIMGHMDVISFISDGFNIYFPMLVLLLCLATYFRIGSRILQFLGFQQFIGDDDMTVELIDEGKEHVKREQRRIERQEDGENRRRNWIERFGENKNIRDRERKKHASNIYGKCSSSNKPSDRIELLQHTESIDYTPESFESYDNASNYAYNVNNSWDTSNYSDYSKNAPIEKPVKYGTANTFLQPPPRNIFDDV